MRKYLLCSLAVFLIFIPSAQAAGQDAKWERYLPPVGRCTGADSAKGNKTSLERSMRCMVNYARGKNGLKSLGYASQLMKSADFKSQTLDRCDQFTHTPCGQKTVDPFRKAGYVRNGWSWRVGENLAWRSPTSKTTPRHIMRMWLNSPGHRKNILSSRWKSQGISLRDNIKYQGRSGAELWVQHFGARSR
jgi:uncharacterized protein YkwD